MTKHLLLLFILLGSAFCSRGQNWNHSPKMTIDDMIMIEPGMGYVMTWHDHDKWIDSNKVFCEIYKESREFKTYRGVLCFELLYNHRWRSCDCEPIDSSIAELQFKYKYDKEFRKQEDSAIKISLDRLKIPKP